MVVCVVANCPNNEEINQEADISFHPFPREQLALAQWLTFCDQRAGVNTKTAMVCSKHFKNEDFENFMKYEMGFAKKLKLNKDAIPTIHVRLKSDHPGPVAVKLRLEKVSQDVDVMNKKVADLQRENFILRTAETDLKKEINTLRLELARTQFMTKNFENRLKKIFSEEQIRQLKNEKRVRWSDEDISRSIALFSASHRAYKMLLKMDFPFPAVRTLLSHQKKEKDKAVEEIKKDNDTDAM